MINVVWSKLFAAPLWIPKDQAVSIANKAFTFLNLYMQMASEAAQEGRLLFLLNAKAHMMSHIFRSMLWQADLSELALNPLTFGVQMEEDVVGKCSRLLRRVSPQAAVQQTLRRWLIAAATAWSNEGMWVRV